MDEAERTRQDSPGIIAPPPLLYLGAFATGMLINFVFSRRILENGILPGIAGLALLAAGAMVARWSFVTMKRMGTSADPRKSSTALATDGPFRRSRNPIYLAMTMLYAGASFILNELWPLVLLIPLLLLMQHGVILREEKYLEGKFGKPYLEYKSRTRRWL